MGLNCRRLDETLPPSLKVGKGCEHWGDSGSIHLPDLYLNLFTIRFFFLLQVFYSNLPKKVDHLINCPFSVKEPLKALELVLSVLPEGLASFKPLSTTPLTPKSKSSLNSEHFLI